MGIVRQAALASVAVALSACRDTAPRELGTPSVLRDIRGDTSVVRTVGEGKWGPARQAEPVLEIRETSPETQFGDVAAVAAMPDGGVAVLDQRSSEGLVIRRFDADGRFVRNIGREGGGPGEYSSVGQVTMAVQSDGSLIVRDGARAILRYSPDGSYRDGFRLDLGRGTGLGLVAADDGSVYVQGRLRPSSADARRRLPAVLRYSASGRVLDSIVDPTSWLTRVPRSRYEASEVWMPTPDRRIMYFRTDKVGFLVVDPSHRSKPLLAEIAAEPVPYLGEEREELRRIDEWRHREMPAVVLGPPSEIPTEKLPSKWGFVDLNGRIWVARTTVAERVPGTVAARAGNKTIMVTYEEPPAFAAFESDGSFLGEVDFPVGARPSFVGNTAWAVVLASDGVPTLVKYRIY